MSTKASALNEVYKSTNLSVIISITKLYKDDISHSSCVCFHILFLSYDTNVSCFVLFFYFTFKLQNVFSVIPATLIKLLKYTDIFSRMPPCHKVLTFFLKMGLL